MLMGIDRRSSLFTYYVDTIFGGVVVAVLIETMVVYFLKT